MLLPLAANSFQHCMTKRLTAQTAEIKQTAAGEAAKLSNISLKCIEINQTYTLWGVRQSLYAPVISFCNLVNLSPCYPPCSRPLRSRASSWCLMIEAGKTIWRRITATYWTSEYTHQGLLAGYLEKRQKSSFKKCFSFYNKQHTCPFIHSFALWIVVLRITFNCNTNKYAYSCLIANSLNVSIYLIIL